MESDRVFGSCDCCSDQWHNDDCLGFLHGDLGFLHGGMGEQHTADNDRGIAGAQDWIFIKIGVKNVLHCVAFMRCRQAVGPYPPHVPKRQWTNP